MTTSFFIPEFRAVDFLFKNTLLSPCYLLLTLLLIIQYWYLTLLCIIQYNMGMMNEKRTKDFEKLKQEMRRGVIVLAAMSQLKQEQYGYSLIKNLKEKGFEVGQDTLYPLLRRLEQQELLDSEWRLDDPRPRRYYVLNETGAEMLQDLKAVWREQVEIIRSLLDETE